MISLCSTIGANIDITETASTTAIYTQLAEYLTKRPNSGSFASPDSETEDEQVDEADEDNTDEDDQSEDDETEVDETNQHYEDGADDWVDEAQFDTIFGRERGARGNSGSFADFDEAMPLTWCTFQLVQRKCSAFLDPSTNLTECYNNTILKARKCLPTGAIIYNLLNTMTANLSRLTQNCEKHLSKPQLTTEERVTHETAWDGIVLRIAKSTCLPPPYRFTSVCLEQKLVTLESVKNPGKFRKVDLSARTCDCNFWQGSGYPCLHALVAKQLGFVTSTAQLIPPYLNIRTVRDALQPLLSLPPLPQSFKEKDAFKLTLPPQPKAPGRPKKTRHKRSIEKKKPNAKRPRRN
jgi:hypothetical protein